MRILIFLLTILVSSTIFSQEKRYFDADWKDTSKENASFYREVVAVSDFLYSMKDYFINGTLQMEAFSTDSIKFVYEKTAVWYDQDGDKELSAEFENDKIHGKAIHYLKNGEIKYQGTFVDGNPHSGYIKNNCNACIKNVSEYKNGEVLSTNYFYTNSSQIAAKRHYLTQKKYSFDNLRTDKKVFYDQNNKIIATLFYYNDESGYAYPKEGVDVIFYNNDDREVTSIKSKTTYANHYKDGLVITYSEDGKEFSRGTYKKGEPYNGSIYQYNSLRSYVDGVPSGEQIFYDKDGNIFSKAIYKDGKIYEGKIKDYRSENYYEKGELMKVIEYQDYDFKIKKSEIYYINGDDSQRKWYDDKGKLIAECDFVEGRPYNGVEYYSYHNKYTPYINGVKHGIEKILDDENKTIKETRYSLDTIVDVVSFLPNTNEKLLCTYKNGDPFNGEEFDYRANTYKNGSIIKEQFYVRDYKNDKLILNNIYTFEDDSYNVSHQTSFKGNIRYELVYKDGSPFEGTIYDDQGKLVEYKNATENGTYFYYQEDTILIEKGMFVDGKKDGIINYAPVDEKPFTCIYKDGKPFEGTALEYTNKNQYKNGLKNGICETKYPYVSTTTYVDGKKEGAFFVIVNGFNFGGEYKNDEPYTGAFLNEDGFETKYMIEHYNKGKKDGIFSDYINDYGVLTEMNYEAGVITWQKSILTRKDSVIAYADFKDGKITNGKIVSRHDIDRLKISPYKNGKLSGIENFYTYSYKIFLKDYGYTTYKNGLKNGKYSKSYEIDYDEKKVVGTYKNGKPFNGDFVTLDSELEIISKYKRGLKHGVETYLGDDYGSDKKKTELIYNKGKIVEGQKLEPIEALYHEFYIHHYKNGEKEKIEIPASSGSSFMIAKGNNLRYLYENLIIDVNYSNPEKTSGTIVYTENEIKIGKFEIENGSIISGDINIKHPDDGFFLTQELVNNKLISKIFSTDLKLYYQYTSNAIMKIDSFDHTSLKHIKSGLEPGKNDITFTIHKEEKIISELTIEGNKIKSGIMVRFPDFWNENYTISYVKDFKFGIDVENIKYEDLEKEIEKLKKKLSDLK